MRFKLKNRDCEHFDHVKSDGIYVEAVSWKPNCRMPGWSSYQVDPVSVPGMLMIITPGGGEEIACNGDMIVLCNNGLMAIDPDDFFSVYKEA